MSETGSAHPYEEAFRELLRRLAAGESAESFLERQPEALRAELELLLGDYRAADALGGAEPPAAGRVLGGFRLVEELGRGGMGVVWEAEELALGRRVALKLVLDARLRAPGTLERFRREAEAAARLAHPAIVAVLSVGEADGLPYIAQELVPGGVTLADHLATLRETDELPPDHFRRTAETFLTLAEALAAAHAARVLHRDVKPGNVLLADGTRPKLADFGLARLEGAEALSITGTVLGTPHYASPEQTLGRELDARTDVFSLGATLYEALTLRRPFEGDRLEQVLRKVREEDPPDPRALRSKVPADLAVIARKALEKRPQDRYADMAAMADDLRRHLQHLPISAREPGLVERARKWSRRHPAIAVGAATMSAAVVALSISLAQVVEARGEVSVQLDENRQQLAENELQLARNALQRGAWRDALESLEAAREAGYSDPVELDLLEARVLLADYRSDEALRRFEALAARDDLGPHEASAELWHGAALLHRWEDGEGGLQRVERALALGLPEAEERLARALLEPRMPRAVELLREAIELDPFDYFTNTTLLGLLVLSGQHEEAIWRAHAYGILYPEDYTALLVPPVARLLRGDEEAGFDWVEAEERVGPEDADKLMTMTRAVGQLVGMLRMGGSIEERIGSLRGTAAFAGLPASLEDLRAGGAGLSPALPCIAQGPGRLLEALSRLKPRDFRLAQAALREVAEVWDDGFAHTLRAAALVETIPFEPAGYEAVLREIWASLQRARERPSLLPFAAEPMRDGLIVACCGFETMYGLDLGDLPDADEAGRLAVRAARSGYLQPVSFSYLLQALERLGQADAGLIVLDAWRAQGVAELEELFWSARLLLLAGRPAEALEAADALLAELQAGQDQAVRTHAEDLRARALAALAAPAGD